MGELWSWVLTGVGILGIYLAGRKFAWAWLILVFEEMLWITYSIVTQQWGFFVAGFLYGGVYVKNYVQWHRQDEADREPLLEAVVS
jgi:hypothetical protein